MTAAEFQLAFPVFATERVADIERLFVNALPFVDLGRWGSLYDEGVRNYVAHMLAVDRMDRDPARIGANDVTSKSVGSASVARSAELLAAQAHDPFMRTTYGQRYRYLARLVGMGPVVV